MTNAFRRAPWAAVAGLLAVFSLVACGDQQPAAPEVVAAKAERMVEAFRECGCTLNNAYMQLSLLALVVIPELRISDLGVVDVRRFRASSESGSA